MLYPVDANNNEKCLQMFREQITNNEMLYLIRNKTTQSPGLIKKLTTEEADQLIISLKSRSVFQITKGHGCVISPHFAGAHVDDGLLITDFIMRVPSQRNRTEEMRNNVHLAGTSMLYGSHGFPWVYIPIDVEPHTFPDVEVQKISGGLVFKRRKNQ